MDLIDWPGVFRNSLWILGLSIALASWSYTSWWAALRHTKVRRALDLPRFQVPFAIGLALFTGSLAWGATRWWERGLWSVLCLAFLWQAGRGWRWAAGHGWGDLPDREEAGDRAAKKRP